MSLQYQNQNVSLFQKKSQRQWSKRSAQQRACPSRQEPCHDSTQWQACLQTDEFSCTETDTWTDTDKDRLDLHLWLSHKDSVVVFAGEVALPLNRTIVFPLCVVQDNADPLPCRNHHHRYLHCKFAATEKRGQLSNRKTIPHWHFNSILTEVSDHRRKYLSARYKSISRTTNFRQTPSQPSVLWNYFGQAKIVLNVIYLSIYWMYVAPPKITIRARSCTRPPPPPITNVAPRCLLSLTFVDFDLAPKWNKKFGYCRLDLV